ncbi:MAG: MATE family efflux transporter [Lachnospiraceae bacterium]|nr:MATE family efflux transporter [Lachnospiraceae bacterium]
MEQNRLKENKMGTMPINQLLLNMSLPMMISMLVQALYNVVDSVFVSRINENALTAVSLAFPLQNLMIAVAAGTGVGVNALLSKSLGEKNYEKVNRTADNAVFLALISYLLTLLIGIFGVGIFYRSQTSDAQIVAYGIQYGMICCCLSFGVFLQVTMERLLQSTGKTFYTMIIQGTGAIINIIMDPILIFGLFGFPRMEVAGAAAATVAGQIVASVLAVILNQRVNHEVQLKLKGFRPDLKIISQIYKVGIPSIIMQSIASVMVYGMNRILIAFTSTATAVFGVYFKLQSFIFMPVFGLNNGMIPIVAYNYGANSRKRVVQTIKYSTMYAVLIMAVGTVIFQVFPANLLIMFKASETMLQLGVPALRIISFSFIIAGYCIICSSVFQALGNGFYSLIVSVARQLIVLLPAACLLSRFGNVNYVWWSFPIAEAASLVMSTAFLIRIHQKIISKLK